LFIINEKDTIFHLFANEDDVTKLRYADFNKDGNLDFLEPRHSLSFQEILIRERLNVEGSQAYKIRIVSFQDGKLKYLKDNDGLEYFLFIAINDPLNPESSFQLLGFNWFK
jgi:hypothetical protein